MLTECVGTGKQWNNNNNNKSRVQSQDSGRQRQAVRILAGTLPTQWSQVSKGNLSRKGNRYGHGIGHLPLWGDRGQGWVLKSEESHQSPPGLASDMGRAATAGRPRVSQGHQTKQASLPRGTEISKGDGPLRHRVGVGPEHRGLGPELQVTRRLSQAQPPSENT